MKLFSTDSKFYKTLVSFYDAIKLNILWILFSLPIITIGASTVAAYHVGLKIASGEEGYILKPFLKAFKENFVQGVILGLITLIAVYAMYLNIEFFNKIEDNPIIFLILGIVVGFMALTYLLYAFPLAARYKSSVFRIMTNSQEITFKYYGKTVLLWLIIILIIIVFLYNYTLMFIGIFIGPISIILTVSNMANRIFKDIEKNNLSE